MMTNAEKQKLYKFELDQSGRIEELNRPTIIGLANNEAAYTVRIKARVKKSVWEIFRRAGKTKMFGPQAFESAVFFTVEKSKFKISELVIDLEYPGYEIIAGRKLEARLFGINTVFRSIGKKSPAHYAAYGVFISKRKPDHEMTEKELKDALLKLK